MSCVKWYKFHDWKDVYEEISLSFLGEKCKKPRLLNFRKCNKCGVVQQLKADWGETGKWENLTECQTNVFNSKIVNENDLIILIDY